MSEQRFNLPQELGIIGTGGQQEPRAGLGIALKGRMVEAFDPTPTV